MKWWQIYILAWAGTAVLSAVLTVVCRYFAPVFGLVDQPREEKHKGHKRATPMLGGLAMFLAWVAVICAGLCVSGIFGRLISPRVAVYLPGIQTVIPQLATIVCSAGALVALGVIDDRWHLGAFAKLAGQFCVAGATACWGVRVTALWSDPLMTWAITTFWLLLIINAMNFFDNMDGLAAGTAATAAFIFLFVAALRGQYFVAILASVTGGAISGFLFFNCPRASVFMGDAGSHFLGYSLAVIGALTTYYTPSESPTPAPLLIPLLVLGVPIFDAVAVVFMRIRRGQPIYIGDNTHISHRFTMLGLSRVQAVVVVWLLSFAIGAGAVVLLWIPIEGAVIVILQSVAILTVISLVQFYFSSNVSDSDG